MNVGRWIPATWIYFCCGNEHFSFFFAFSAIHVYEIHSRCIAPPPVSPMRANMMYLRLHTLHCRTTSRLSTKGSCEEWNRGLNNRCHLLMNFVMMCFMSFPVEWFLAIGIRNSESTCYSLNDTYHKWIIKKRIYLVYVDQWKQSLVSLSHFSDKSITPKSKINFGESLCVV